MKKNQTSNSSALQNPLVVIALIFGAVLGLAFFATPEQKTSAPAAAEEQLNQKTPDELADSLENLISESAEKKEYDAKAELLLLNYMEALEKIDSKSPRAKAAIEKGKKLKIRFSELKKKQEKQIADTVRSALVSARKEAAKQYELDMLREGLDTHITTRGKEHDTLVIEYVLMSRPTVLLLSESKNFQHFIRLYSFKKVILTDGYNNSWTLNY